MSEELNLEDVYIELLGSDLKAPETKALLVYLSEASEDPKQPDNIHGVPIEEIIEEQASRKIKGRDLTSLAAGVGNGLLAGSLANYIYSSSESLQEYIPEIAANSAAVAIGIAAGIGAYKI